MKIVETGDFKKSLKKLPSEIEDLYKKQTAIFQYNWLDPRLHTKRIRELPGSYSLRITRRYRVLFYFKDSGTAIFFEIGHRKDVYRE